jgi:type I restriction enzyme S subunit
MDEHIANLTELIEKKKGIRDGALEDLVSGRTRVKGFEKLKSNNIRIDTFLKVKRGKRLVRSQLSNYANSNAKVPVYQNSVVALGYYSSPNCCPQSVFVIAAGNAGDIGFSTVPFWAADDCYYFEPNEKIHQKYLYYCLLNEQQYIYSQTRRTSIPRLSHDVLERIIILVPSIAEQKAIATVLTTMDDEIVALEEEKDKMMQIKAGAMDDLLTGRIRLTRQGG